MRLEWGFWSGAVLDCRVGVVILVFCFVFCLQDGVVLWCWGGVLRMGMLRDWTRMLRDWNGEWVWGESEDVNGGDFPVGLSWVSVLYFCTGEWLRWKWMRKKGKCSWNWWLAMMETDWEVMNRMSEGVVFHLVENRMRKSPLSVKKVKVLNEGISDDICCASPLFLSHLETWDKAESRCCFLLLPSSAIMTLNHDQLAPTHSYQKPYVNLLVFSFLFFFFKKTKIKIK